jgi:hypothetical protein
MESHRDFAAALGWQTLLRSLSEYSSWLRPKIFGYRTRGVA